MGNQIAVNFPVPPDAVMPEPLQFIFLVLTAVAAAVVLAWSFQLAFKYKSPVPVMMAVGGFVAIIMETVVTFLGHAIHPEPGQIQFFKAVNRAIPWHIALGYMAGFGIFYLYMYSKLQRGELGTGTIWKSAIISAVGYFVGEAYFVSNGLWVYYDYQPLHIWKGTAPLTWNWLNTACMFTGFTLMYYMSQYLKGVGSVILPALAASGAYVGHMGAGFPMYNAMNTDWPVWVLELSGVASIAFAVLYIWLSGRVLLAIQASAAR
jgi:hypothetical protein